ncbi:hypothetical protein [Cystobacter fuscus]|uniref:hypothetical protein n=1 Tax=Cystobacter fuscus TaxID=43 RepID=UPI002B28B187|nr:hypothetical protein F0U63_01430 [Cystobacter fuscus]
MSPIPWRGAVMAVVLSLCGCAGDAVLNTASALGASAVSRSRGGCYAACPMGTTCDKATGLCEQLPCRGACAPYQECLQEGLVHRCVAQGLANNALIIKPTPTPSEQAPAAPPP